MRSKKLAEKYGVKDERKRKLLVVPFFWLMVLSAVESSPRGCLSKMVAFFTATFPIIHLKVQVIRLSEMAISKKPSDFLSQTIENFSHDSKTVLRWMRVSYGSIKYLKKFLRVHASHRPL